MKTVEEIVKGLRLCSEKSHCQDCAYLDGLSCDELYLDSQRMIERLIDENRALKTELRTNGKDHFRSGTKMDPDQEAKSDSGKPRLTLVPPKIIWDIAAVRQYGVEVKYPVTGVDGWRTIGEERIRDAAARHFLRYLTDPKGVDEESGLRHLWHLATNIAFLCELEGWENNG